MTELAAQLKITDEDIYNTDGNGVIRIVEREDGMFAEAADGEGPFTGMDADGAAIAGAGWYESPNEVIEAWYTTFRDEGQLIRPNRR